MRLVELVCVAIHEIAVAVFNLQPKSHTEEHISQVTKWQIEAGWIDYGGGDRAWEEPSYPPPPTHFYHFLFCDYDLYPNGIADIAGYWAEDQICGGVALFNRGESGTEVSKAIVLSHRTPPRAC